MAIAANVPTAVVELDRPRTLAFTLGAMRRIRERTGTLAMDTSDEGAVLAAIGAWVWACLVEDDRDGLSVEQVEDMIHPGNLSSVVGAIGRLGDVKGAEGNAVPAPAKARKPTRK